MCTVAGADWGFQPAKTPTKQSGARLPVSGASTPLAAAPAAKPGPGSPAWQAWPGSGGNSNQGTPVKEAAAGGGDANRDPVCAPPPRRQPHVQSIARPLGTFAISGGSSVSGAIEVCHQVDRLSWGVQCPLIACCAQAVFASRDAASPIHEGECYVVIRMPM